MQPSLVLQKIARGETVITAKAGYTDPELVELVASSGFDAVWICLEHKRMDPSTVYALIQACRLGGADALIRVKPSNYTDVLHLIEAGARGIMLPRVVHPATPSSTPPPVLPMSARSVAPRSPLPVWAPAT